MKDLLRCCAADTGCDEKTVKTIAASLLESIAKRLSAGRDVDLHDELGLYIANENSNQMPKNSSQSLSEHRYTITIYQCNTPEYPLSADFSPFTSNNVCLRNEFAGASECLGRRYVPVRFASVIQFDINSACSAQN